MVNDEAQLRLRPRRSNHGRNENPRARSGVLRSMLRIVQMSKYGHRTSGAGVRTPRTFNQRVAVRVTYCGNTNRGQWKAHGKYVARESATQGGKAITAGFNGTDQALNIPTTLDNWQSSGDERLFKIIVSPEFADHLDLQRHTRAMMLRMELDLATELQWIATVHHNTEHPHVHIAVRAVDDKGAPLRLPRDYIRSGLRSRAEEVATEAVGYRSAADAHEAQRRETLQNRFTSLDRILQRSNDGSSLRFVVIANPNHASLSESGRQLQTHLSARLIHLQTMGLARLVAPCEWAVQADFEKVLRTLQQTKDRQKMLAAHGALASDKRLPFQITNLRQVCSVAGRVLLHTEDEQTGKRYMLLEGTDAKVHLIYHNGAIEKARQQGQLSVDSFARIEKTFVRKKLTLEVHDLGDANALLQNSLYLRKEAALLLRRGVRDVKPVWGGWLGQYEIQLRAELSDLVACERNNQGRGR
jgi:hypothetical protein